MIHLLEVDDSTMAGKRLIKEADKAKKGVKFRSPAINGVPPEGYMTSEDAYKEISRITDELCRKYGILE